MTGERRPLVVTGDPGLLDDMLGAAAAVGVAVDVAVDPGACRPQWTSAPLVLIGEDIRPALAGSALRPRPGVLVVRRGASDDEAQADATDAEERCQPPNG